MTSAWTVTLLCIAVWDGVGAADSKLANLLGDVMKLEAEDRVRFFNFVKSEEKKDPQGVGKIVMQTLLLDVLSEQFSVTDLEPLKVDAYAVTGRGQTTTNITTSFTAKVPAYPGKIKCQATVGATIEPPSLFDLLIPSLPRFELLGDSVRCDRKIKIRTGLSLKKYAHDRKVPKPNKVQHLAAEGKPQTPWQHSHAATVVSKTQPQNGHVLKKIIPQQNEVNRLKELHSQKNIKTNAAPQSTIHEVAAVHKISPHLVNKLLPPNKFLPLQKVTVEHLNNLMYPVVIQKVPAFAPGDLEIDADDSKSDEVDDLSE